jgi:hypothetical protein
MSNAELLSHQDVLPVVTLVDVDGTVSDTRTHMEGYNDRLAAAFPEIPDGLLSELGAARVAYRKQYANLPHSEQSGLWNQQHPGQSFDSQTSFLEGEAPDVFTPELMERIRQWGTDPENFGHGEYDDVAPLLAGLRRIGSMPILFTLGSRERTTGEPGWQERKILSAPNLRDLPRHVAERLPEGGKGEVISTWYDDDTDTFRIPRTDGGAIVVARSVALVDDVWHNIEHTPGQALGILLDRKGKHGDQSLPGNIRVATSLTEVPAMVSEYAAMRQAE